MESYNQTNALAKVVPQQERDFALASGEVKDVKRRCLSLKPKAAKKKLEAL
ncbi:predicted protein [Sclerotinia sclerotiorum 1980 UF-70]|uniref:Uncharacterized protein n=1 Tax=Sclerotinia sclerotiorum (strain ATCC 18683 / 1980 / Ss-1) TaxID=665079 RepID=A7EAI9_SCLS1|nr:predicted protein [Sclerotinia sclerotiorum 1980 UF-70]EDN99467.1 predicted protein [Sclerotinia sclerotiorum 1980 UF-70]